MRTRELDGPPNLLQLYAKAGLPMLPGASRLPFLAGGGGEVPDLELMLRDVEIDRDHLGAYSSVCAFPESGALPATYPHVLAFPLHMALLTDGSFPFGPVGQVHIANRITQRRSVGSEERLSLAVRATPLEPHPKGRAFSLVTEARVGEELVWEGRSTNLRRGSGGSERGQREPAEAAPAELPASAEWWLKGDLGRRYAAVSGDRNPIHMHDLTARAFGFRRAIAHGMWTKARCLAELDERLPDAFSVEVAFRKPILLPATVGFAASEDDRPLRFAVRDGQDATPHLDGTLTPR